ncbi:hypothetical protein PZBJ_19485 [Pantoea endophytica]|uniref:Uncharacterized protein n=1 Tax=Pantoea endophytica TaxID=92488 RepID=A0ABX4SLS1_9GAMM|nr:hypothetical protein PZBJ_19485 [Pantoea endophytica]QCP57911.1 hypothetical protein FCN45_00250 [Pantoea sp. SO10]
MSGYCDDVIYCCSITIFNTQRKIIIICAPARKIMSLFSFSLSHVVFSESVEISIALIKSQINQKT